MGTYEWMLLPVLGSVGLCLLLVPLGYEVLARGVVFADLAIAQWAALGALAGVYLLPAVLFMGVSVASLAFALLSAAAVHWLLPVINDAREAWIGALYVLGASLAVLLVSGDPHGAQALQRVASGDLLWARGDVVVVVTSLAILVWGLGFFHPRWLSGGMFLPVFALAVTYAVSLAGIYVVFATLIVTPLVLGRCLHCPPLVATGCAVIGHLGAITVSVVGDLPVGPSIVVSILICALFWLSISRRFAAKNPGTLRPEASSR